MEVQGRRIKLSTLSNQPAYNVKAVCLRTGITATTLRAWERRYGLPSPHRSVQGYRLYSERDVTILEWLLQQTNSGISISYAVQQLTLILHNDQELVIKPTLELVSPVTTDPRSPDLIVQNIVDALLEMRDSHADALIMEAFALYTPETVLTTILLGVRDAVDEEVHSGSAPSIVESMASNAIKQRIVILLQTSPPAKSERPVLVVGFADEHTELELLVLNTLLRRSGFLAATMLISDEITLAMIADEANGIDAAMMIFYVDSVENAERLANLPVIQDQLGDPIWLVCCGKGSNLFTTIKDRRLSHIDYLGSDLRQVMRELFSNDRSPFSGKLKRNQPRVKMHVTS